MRHDQTHHFPLPDRFAMPQHEGGFRRHHGGPGHGPDNFGRPPGFGPAGGGRGVDGPGSPDPRGTGFGPRGGMPGFGPRRGGPGRRGRAPRGDVRTAVLLLLADEPMHGYQLMQTIEMRTGGRWSPSPGAIYPTLAQLEDEGLVETTKEGGRKLASLTAQGRTHVEENREQWPDPFPQAPAEHDGQHLDLRVLARELGGPIRDLVHTGSDQQVETAARILRETKRSLYQVLADDGRAETSPREEPTA